MLNEPHLCFHFKMTSHDCQWHYSVPVRLHNSTVSLYWPVLTFSRCPRSWTPRHSSALNKYVCVLAMAWPLWISECQCWVGLQTVPVTTLNPASGNRSTLYQTTKPGLAPSLWLTVNSPPAQSQQCCYSVSQLNGYYTPLCVFIWLWQVNYWTSLCHEDNWPVKPLWNLIHLLHFITTAPSTVCKSFITNSLCWG